MNPNGKELTGEEIDKIKSQCSILPPMASNAGVPGRIAGRAAGMQLGDPTEAALIAASTKLGTRSPREDEENPKLQEFSFDSNRKRMSSMGKVDNRVVLCMKGALGSIL